MSSRPWLAAKRQIAADPMTPFTTVELRVPHRSAITVQSVAAWRWTGEVS